MEYRVRRAVRGDIKALNELAVRSESHWGFDEGHITLFKRLYAIQEDHIEKGWTFVLERDSDILGFYCVVGSRSGYELGYMYVDPREIGKGLGKTLWTHMVRLCAEEGIKELTIVCSDVVKDFYLRMGAEFLGRVESTVDKGTTVARLRYRSSRRHE